MIAYRYHKDFAIGVIHHICGEPEWAEGECNHGPLTENESGKKYFKKYFKAAKAIRDIVFERDWLKSLE